MFSFQVLIFFVTPSIDAAENLAWIGDSQGAWPNYLLDKLKPVLKKGGRRINSGQAVCGATINGYLKGGQSGCNIRRGGSSYFSALRGKSQFHRGQRGLTTRVEHLAKGAGTTIIQLGDNHLSNPNISKLVEKMASQVLSRSNKCIWIGPASVPRGKCSANRRKKQQVSEVIKKTLESYRSPEGKKCLFIDSFSATDRSPPKSRLSAL